MTLERVKGPYTMLRQSDKVYGLNFMVRLVLKVMALEQNGKSGISHQAAPYLEAQGTYNWVLTLLIDQSYIT